MDWNSSILWGIIGLIGGFLISLLFYLVGKKRRRISYAIETFPIISEKVSQVNDLVIKYKSKEIETLYFSTVVIRNIGNTIIDKQDFAPAYPLSISTDGFFLVDSVNGINLCPLNEASNTYPAFIVNEDNGECKKIVIGFDYIPKYEEFTCSFFHSGDIVFDGILKDGKIMDNDSLIKREKIFRIISYFLSALISCVITVLLSIKTAY